jgi:hypothetical protein
MKLLLSIGSILSAAWCIAQTPKVVFSVEPRSVAVGEVVVLEIESTVEGDIEIDNLPSSFLQSQGMNSTMRTSIDMNTGKMVTYFQYLQAGVFSKAGKYTVGPVYIKQGNKTHKSNTVVVNVGQSSTMISSEITAQQLRDPAFGVIQTNKTSLYEGEPLLISAKVYTKFNPTYIDRYTGYSMKGVIDKHPIGNGVTKTSMETFRGMSLFTFEYDRNLVFPVGTGDFKIRSYSMSVYDDFRPFSLTSSSAVVTIKPLPSNAPADFIGAVGIFDIDRFVEVHNLQQGDVFKLKIVISGTGNLQNIQEPRPELPKGFVIYGDPTIEQNFSYTSEGADGSVSYEYNIQVNEYGELLLPPTSISYFNVEDEKYVTVKTGAEKISVKKNKNFVVQSSEEDDASDEEKVDELAQLRTSNLVEAEDHLFGTALFWGGISLPLACAFLFLLFTRRKESAGEEMNMRHELRKMEQALVQDLAQLKIQIAKGEDSAAYANMDSMLRRAMARHLSLTHPQGRMELLTALRGAHKSTLADRIESLLKVCDENRYGFGAGSQSVQETMEQLLHILEELK